MKICGIEGCEREVRARGLCHPHYMRWYKYGDIPTFWSGVNGNRQDEIITNKPSSLMLGWLIGLLEGEGHFTYDRTQIVILGMTDEDVVEKAKILMEYVLGCSSLHVIITRARSTDKTMYSIRLYGAKARAIMKLIVKHMGARRRMQIWQALNGYRPQYNKTDINKVFDFSKLLNK